MPAPVIANQAYEITIEGIGSVTLHGEGQRLKRYKGDGTKYYVNFATLARIRRSLPAHSPHIHVSAHRVAAEPKDAIVFDNKPSEDGEGAENG